MTELPRQGERVLKVLFALNATTFEGSVETYAVSQKLSTTPHKPPYAGRRMSLSSASLCTLLKRLHDLGMTNRFLPDNRPRRFGYKHHLTDKGLEIVQAILNQQTKAVK